MGGDVGRTSVKRKLSGMSRSMDRPARRCCGG